MKAFFDHNLSRHMARAINAVVSCEGHEAIAKSDKFDLRTEDSVWIRQLGEEGGWTIFSGDLSILRNPVERAAFYDARMTGFFFKPAVARLPVLQQTATVLWHWNAIVSLVQLQERGAYSLPINKTSKFSAIRV